MKLFGEIIGYMLIAICVLLVLAYVIPRIL